MANSITQEIKDQLKSFMKTKGKSTWGEAVQHVSREMSISEMYVDRAMGEMVKQGELNRYEGVGGFPRYSLSASPGAIEGQYKPITERRIGLESESAGPSKSGTYDQDPRREQVNDRKAV